MTAENRNKKEDVIRDYLIGEKYSYQYDHDEFTDHTKIFIGARDRIMFCNDFDDIEFADIQECTKAFLRAKVDMVYNNEYNKLSPSERELLPLDRKNDYYEAEFERIRNCNKKLSRLYGQLAYNEDSATQDKYIILNVYFSNVSHHRDIHDMVVYFKNEEGEMLCLNQLYAVSSIDTKSGSYELSHEMEYRDYASFALSDKEIDFFIRSKDIIFSARFGKMKIDGQCYCEQKDFDYLNFLIDGFSMSDDQIDSIYENVQMDMERDRKFEAEQKRIEHEAEIKEKIEKKIGEIKKLELYRFDYAKYLATKPNNLPGIKQLRKICSENNTQNTIIDFLDSIPAKYNTNKIVQDIDAKNSERNKYDGRKSLFTYLAWPFLIMFFISSNCYWSDVLIYTFLLGAIAFFVLRYHYKHKDVFFGEETVKMIEDFKKVLNQDNSQ